MDSAKICARAAAAKACFQWHPPVDEAAFQDFGVWMDGELAQLEVRFAAFQTPHSLATSYLADRPQSEQS